MKIFRLVFTNVIVFVILFVVADLIIGHIKIPYDYNEFRERNSIYHHGLKANAEKLACWGELVYPFYTNSLGFRDSTIRKVSVNKTDNYRILFLGDSHTEGVGVSVQKTFFGLMSRILKERGIEILNGSAVSYSPKIHYCKGRYLLENIKLEIDELWIFVDISDMQNEIAYENYQPYNLSLLAKLKNNFIEFLSNHSYLVYILNSRNEARELNQFIGKMAQYDARSLSTLQRNTVGLYKEFFRDFNNDLLLRSPEFHGVGSWYTDSATMPLAQKGLSLGMGNILKIKQICDKQGIKLKVSVHPWQTQIFKGDTADYYVSSWQEFCYKNQIGFVNLFPVFINGENPDLVVNRDYIYGDNHWNESGHSRVANYLISKYYSE